MLYQLTRGRGREHQKLPHKIKSPAKAWGLGGKILHQTFEEKSDKPDPKRPKDDSSAGPASETQESEQTSSKRTVPK